MGHLGTQAELHDAYDALERLERDAAGVRERQELVVARFLDEQVVPRLREVARDLGFGFDGARARGIALERGSSAPALFVLLAEESWLLIERRAHGMSAVVTRVTTRALLDAFGRESVAALLAALAEAQQAVARGVAERERRARASSVERARAITIARAPAARPADARPRTQACPECDARPNAENFARHLRAIHGVAPGAASLKRSPRPAHETCRLCEVRLPAGRLDAHLTAAHGIFHVHPLGDVAAARREAAKRSARRALPHVDKTREVARARSAVKRAGDRDLAGSLVHAPSSGRNFLRETRHERTLVARADSPGLDRDRSGRFSDAPDVERMDDDSDA